MKHKNDTQILSKWNDTDFKLYAKTKQRINCNELKGEEQQQTVDFFLTVYHSYSFVTLLFQQRCQVKWPPWSLEDLLIKKGRKSKHFTAWQHQTWRSESMVTVTSACLLTPWDDVIRVHFGVNVVNFHNEEVEINSLDQHPTESGRQEILH